MLTFEINDAQLEQRILEKAKTIGKTAQEFLKDLLSKEVQEEVVLDELPFEVPKLDYRLHSRIIDEPIDNENDIDDAPIFQNGIDTIEFAKQLRKQAWRRES